MDKIFISKEEASNKFWGYTRNDNDMTVTAHWGRLGLAGQSKVHQLGSTWKVDDFIYTKTREKLHNGYNEVTAEQYEVEVAVAKSIGTDQKVDQLMFVEDKADILHPLDATRLHNPDLKPLVYAKLIGTLRDGVRPTKEFIFTPTESFVIETTPMKQVLRKTKIDGGEDARMAAAVEEVVGRVLF